MWWQQKYFLICKDSILFWAYVVRPLPSKRLFLMRGWRESKNLSTLLDMPWQWRLLNVLHSMQAWNYMAKMVLFLELHPCFPKLKLKTNTMLWLLPSFIKSIVISNFYYVNILYKYWPCEKHTGCSSSQLFLLVHCKTFTDFMVVVFTNACKI